jgi:hypothetical protein
MSDRWAFGIHFVSDEISAKSIFSVRRAKAYGPQWVRVPPGSWFVPPGSNRSSGRGNEAVEASGVEARGGGLASM